MTFARRDFTPEKAARSTMLWDQHSCISLDTGAELFPLQRYRRSGGTFVSINVGYSPHSTEQAERIIQGFRRQIDASSDFTMAATVADVEEAIGVGRIAVAFDLEDCAPLEGDLGRVQHFYDLGVRALIPTYNYGNAAGSGCLDLVDEGLTGFGRNLVRTMNEVGMLADASHVSVRTGLDMCSVSSQPVIYSHSCMRGVWDHERNVTDIQAKECANTGGVLGIAGVGIFLGPNTPTVEAMVRHVDYAVSLMGIEHVGIGSDYSFDSAKINSQLQDFPDRFPEAYKRWGSIKWMAPEQLIELEEAVLDLGYSESDVRAIMGGNFARVARQAWGTDPGI